MRRGRMKPPYAARLEPHQDQGAPSSKSSTALASPAKWTFGRG